MGMVTPDAKVGRRHQRLRDTREPDVLSRPFSSQERNRVRGLGTSYW